MSNEILRLIEESMEADENTVALGQELDWDSIAVVTFMALVDERLNKTISADRLNKCETVDQVVELVAA
ncbi:phosphopantetheine-binding protein [Pseudomonas saxonica]|uniref:phosphopantetheine-binding protein n=1 Tax=Pseudomonas saxonica TaxID=2600598 RepID=UPI000F046617|nr:phosphopantetheine-binding protein [Pseudomonas saxonica]WRQ74243.1 phosphopantetheine-binding protein [Pseudomonas saxonica]